MTPYDGVSADALATRWDVPACIVYERVSSTLDVVHTMATDGAPSGLVVLADEQVAGRGRQGRAWFSPPGSGVWLGYLTRPDAGEIVRLLSIRVGLAVAHALERISVTLELKWPNDLMLQDRKVGGVLCEARWETTRPAWVAVGVGLNVRGPLPKALDLTAVALDAVRPGVTRLEVLDCIVPELSELPSLPQLMGEELTAFARRDWLNARRLREPVEGTARGLAADGALLVETDDGRVERVVGGSIVAR
jgi:BirA family biotin operon repressor/biotin-[acetyl-CoA-carboxylase] ligase